MELLIFPSSNATASLAVKPFQQGWMVGGIAECTLHTLLPYADVPPSLMLIFRCQDPCFIAGCRGLF